MKPREPYSAWDRFVIKIECDWYDLTQLGFALRVRYAYQVVRYYLGLRKDPVVWDSSEFSWVDFSYISDQCADPGTKRHNHILAIVYALVFAVLLGVSAGLALTGNTP